MDSKKMNRLTVAAVTVSIIICLAFMLMSAGSAEGAASSFEYPEKLFGADMIEINIKADKDKWQAMLDNAISETYIPCDVTVNGKTFLSVGVRPKGNSSLSMVAGSDSDRFSFKLCFDEYIKGQTCFGLDKFVVNNMQADYTYMKEYFTYYLMNFMGVDSPLYNYAHMTVNGEEWGLYLAVECYEDSFVERTYNTSDGNLYSVKMAMGRGKEQPDEIGMPDRLNDGADGAAGMVPGRVPDGAAGGVPGNAAAGVPGGMPGKSDESAGRAASQGKPGQLMRNRTDGTTVQDGLPEGMQGMPGKMPDEKLIQGMAGDIMQEKTMRGFGGSGGGGSLIYTDDNSESYSSIFGNAVFNESDEEDYQRVIKALKKLSEGEELEKYFDVDQILRYFAVHTTVVNLDSYISNMQQNYYLYEKDGKVTILPWDYNLSFGGFQSGDASTVINFTIDTPVSGVELSQRPLIAKLLEITEYKERYHKYLREIADYLSDGQFTGQIQAIDSLISDYVAKDATAFCTYEQYKSAAETFKQLCLLRAKSIQGQLDGTIPSTALGQSGSSALIEAGNVKLSAMGSQGGGKGDMGGNGGRGVFGGMGGKFGPGNFGGAAGDTVNKDSNNGQAPAEAPNPPNLPDSLAFDSTNKQGILWIGVSFAALVIGISIVAVYKRR